MKPNLYIKFREKVIVTPHINSKLKIWVEKRQLIFKGKITLHNPYIYEVLNCKYNVVVKFKFLPFSYANLPCKLDINLLRSLKFCNFCRGND